MKARATAMAIGIALAATLSGCSSDAGGDAPADLPGGTDKALTVEVKNMTYSPASITIQAGQTVTWCSTTAASRTTSSDWEAPSPSCAARC